MTTHAHSKTVAESKKWQFSDKVGTKPWWQDIGVQVSQNEDHLHLQLTLHQSLVTWSLYSLHVAVQQDMRPCAEADAEEPSIRILNSPLWSPEHLSTEHRKTRTSY